MKSWDYIYIGVVLGGIAMLALIMVIGAKAFIDNRVKVYREPFNKDPFEHDCKIFKDPQGHCNHFSHELHV